MYDDINERAATPQNDQAMLDRCMFLGRRLRLIFGISLSMLIMSTLFQGMDLLSSGRVIFVSRHTSFLVLLFDGVSIVLAIAYCAILFSMGTHCKAFAISGILMIVSTFLSVWKEFDERMWLAFLITVAALVTEILQMKYLVDGCEGSLFGVDGGLAAHWNTLWEVYITILGATFASMVCYFIPGIRVFAEFIAFSLRIADVGVSIVMLIMIRQTSDTLIRYSFMQEYKGV